MNSLAYKYETTPSTILNKEDLVTEDLEVLENSVELSEARIKSFFKTPSVETELDENLNSNTIAPLQNFQKNLLRLVPKTSYRQKTSTSSQKWKGHVIEKYDSYFTAIITDISNKNPDEIVELPTETISQDDLHLVVEGALFDWHIGYEKTSGTTQKYSKILFRRMPRWTRSDFDRANLVKNKFKEFLSKQSE